MKGSTMGEKTIRAKTKYTYIYLSQKTGKYDAKYNYKEYDPLSQDVEHVLFLFPPYSPFIDYR